MRRKIAFLLVAFAVYLPIAPLGCGSPSEPAGSASNPIVSGNPASPTSSPYVQVLISNFKWAQTAAYSSGMLLDGWRVLTCGHCLDETNCNGVPAPGNVFRRCEFRAKSHVVRRSNGMSHYPYAGSEHRKVTRVSVHPLYTPEPAAPETQLVDSAILWLDSSDQFPNVPTATLTDETTANLSATKKTVSCHGYGLGTLNADENVLRTADFQIAGLNPDFVAFRVDKTSSGAVPHDGDSGGPCLLSTGEVAGVIRSGQSEQNDAGQYTDVKNAFVVGAEAIKCWKDHLFDGTKRDLNEDMNFDGIPDSVALKPGVACPFYVSPTGKCIAIKTLFIKSKLGTPCESLEFVGLPDFGQLDSLDFATGDFNKDGAVDLIGSFAFADTTKSYQFLLDGTVGDVTKFADLTKLSLNPFTFLSSNYKSFHVADFDKDGVHDVEGLLANGYVDTYFGCEKGSTTCTPGLSDKFESFAFPSAERDDGKFLVLTGVNNGTYPWPKATFVVSSSGPRLSVDVFDGNFGSGWDRYFEGSSVQSCFRLYTDGDPTLTTKTLVAAVSGGSMQENEWTKVYRGAQHAQAKDGQDYWYKLEVSRGDCSTSEPPPAPSPPGLAANAFKVRANDLIRPENDFSFWGKDRVGEAVFTGHAHHPPYDTDYDGKFTFAFDVDSSATCYQLEEADADAAADEDAPSDEYIANDIYYTAEESGGLWTNTNPSGQCSPLLAAGCDKEVSKELNVSPGNYK